MPSVWKRLLVGRPLKTAQSSEERLSKRAALAVFSSDALSSVAYATEEILFVLVAAGAAGLSFSLPIAALITGLMIVVVLSYGQTIRAYPSGGGAYTVAKDNLGQVPSLVAGWSLLIDYVLTVAVSVSAGVAAITSAVPSLYPERVAVGVLVIVLITVANLRGIRESAQVFAVPTYMFIFSMVGLVVVGIWQWAMGTLPPPGAGAMSRPLEAATAFLLLRGFAAGCTALTGIEAISNGVTSFKRPEAKNARTTLYMMGVILGFLFIGVTVLARVLHVAPAEGETVVSQIARAVFGHGGAYYFIQAATAMILLLAANTSYAGFPKLASILAHDKVLPVQLVNQGDRLVYSNGILVLAALSSLLVIGFAGDTHKLIPLYAVGVFIGFSMSQLGMVKKWLTEKSDGWRRGVVLNGVGGAATAVVLAVIVFSKFLHGAWAVLAIIPLGVAVSLGIKRHYTQLRTRLSLDEERSIPVAKEHYTILFVGDIHKGTVAAVRYAKSLQPTHIKALHISFDDQDAGEIREKWNRWGMDIPLIIAPSPYRELVGILLHYIREIERQHPHAAITVIVTEFICPHWWQLLLHNHTAARIKQELLHEHVAVVSVPIQLV
jgi:amino acid transporter